MSAHGDHMIYHEGIERYGVLLREQVLVPPFPPIQPQIGFCCFPALTFNSAWETPAVMVGRFAQPRAELCSVAKVGVGANSTAFEVLKTYKSKVIDRQKRREGIYKGFHSSSNFRSFLTWARPSVVPEWCLVLYCILYEGCNGGLDRHALAPECVP
jgi:hypothetical protein